MTYLASAAAHIQMWIARAGQAYDSGTWGTGTLWSTHYTNAIASRDYWQHTVAHNDPAVWDTRYNAGYAQADLVESPRALTTSTFSVGGQGGAGASSFVGLALTPTSDPLGVWVGSNTLRLRAGTWSIRLWGRFSGGPGTARLRISQSGGALRTTQAGPDSTWGGDCNEYVALGGATDYTFQMAADGNCSLVAGGTVYATFIPTPAVAQ